MDTRCGAAMTLAMPCIVGMLFVYIFGAPNILTIKTLLPELEIEEISNPSSNTIGINMYGNISLQIETLAYTGALGDQSCVDIEAIDSGTQLKCSSTNFTNTTSSKDIVLCSTNVVCIVDNRLTGIQDIVMKFPTAFQKMQWSVQPGKVWYNTQTQIKDALVSDTKEIFSGTQIDPTELNFGIVRGKLSTKTTRKTIYSIESTNKNDFGLQLTWQGSNLKQSKEGPSTPFHYVAFKFAVSENVFSVELSDEKDLLALFTAVFTLLLSIMSFMKIVKIFGQKYLDAYLRFKAEKNGTAIPEDVLRRQRVLDEHNLTNKGTRRLSSVGNVLMGLKNMQDKDKNTDADAETVMNIKKPKKKRRLSSRELIEEQDMMSNPMPKKKTAASSVIEMTELSLASSPRSANSSDFIEVKEENQKLRLELDEMESKLYDQEQRMNEMQQMLKKLTEDTSHLL